MEKSEINEITEGNKLIARFLGYEYFGADVQKFGAGWKKHDNGGIINHPKVMHSGEVGKCHFLCRKHYELRFFNSWTWLMVAVDKIESIGEQDGSIENYHFQIGKRFTRVIYDWDKYLSEMPPNDESVAQDYRHEVFDNNKRFSTWQGVVDFIKWYNNK